MTAPIDSGSQQRHERKAALVLLFTGLALLTASLVGLFPMHYAARLVSDEGQISEALAQRLARSQWALGLSIAAFAWLPMVAPRPVDRPLGWLTLVPAHRFL